MLVRILRRSLGVFGRHGLDNFRGSGCDLTCRSPGNGVGGIGNWKVPWGSAECEESVFYFLNKVVKVRRSWRS